MKWVEFIGSFGLFLFALRFLNNILQRSIARRFRPMLQLVLQTKWQCVAAGVIATVCVQASSITIISAMGLLHSSLITMQQGFLIMLGATIGTTIKGWFFAQAIHNYALLLIGISSFGLIIFRGIYIREILEVILSIGVAFLALTMVSQSIEPLRHSPEVRFLFEYFASKSNYLGIVLCIVAGCLFTILIQSSSTTLFIILELSHQGIIEFPTAVAFILGANIGTTITAIIVSFEYGREVRCLAMSHLIVKVIGVLIAFIFFPYFIALVDFIVPGALDSTTLSYHIAGAHTLFNIFNVIMWFPLAGLILKAMENIFLLSKTSDELPTFLPKNVQRILIGNPKYAIEEIDKKVRYFRDLVKSGLDYCLFLLLDPKVKHESVSNYLMASNFEVTREGIHELCIHVKQAGLKDTEEYLDLEMLRLSWYTSCFYLSVEMKNFLENDSITTYIQEESLHNALEDFQKKFNEVWCVTDPELNIHTENSLPHLKESLQEIQQIYFSLIEQKKMDKSRLYWLSDLIRYLHSLTSLLSSWHAQLEVQIKNDRWLTKKRTRSQEIALMDSQLSRE